MRNQRQKRIIIGLDWAEKHNAQMFLFKANEMIKHIINLDWTNGD
jgi:hypothetical protein